jgi:hypothetical protein
MGHQSYILLAKDEEEVERIVNVIRDHNLHYDTLTEEQKKDDKYDMTGEDLYDIVITGLLKNKPKKYADYNHAILCCNGGGRSRTFNWFYRNNVECEGYMGQKWLSKKYRKIDLLIS